MRTTINVIFMGTPWFACAPLEALCQDKRFTVQAVITQEDKKIGRKQIETPTPVKKVAISHNLPVLQPSKLKGNTDFQKILKDLKPDFIVVAAYGKILDKETLKIPKISCVNIHTSLLPKYRGASPIQQALLNGDRETGIAIMQMSEKMDEGDIYCMQRVPIAEEDTAELLSQRLSLISASMLPDILEDISKGLLSPLKQDSSKATYCTKITTLDGQIDLKKMTSVQISGMIKAYSPSPGCFLIQKNKKIKILSGFAEDTSSEAQQIKPGEIQIGKNEKTLLLGTKHGIFMPLDLQLEGKKPTTVESFLNGYKHLFI
jgi:methionyl-tRNA formyltransferase